MWLVLHSRWSDPSVTLTFVTAQHLQICFRPCRGSGVMGCPCHSKQTVSLPPPLLAFPHFAVAVGKWSCDGSCVPSDVLLTDPAICIKMSFLMGNLFFLLVLCGKVCRIFHFRWFLCRSFVPNTWLLTNARKPGQCNLWKCGRQEWNCGNRIFRLFPPM